MMNKEKKFQIPNAEIVEFRADDVILTSDLGEGDDIDLPEY